MPTKKPLKWILILFLLSVNIGCDQVSKNIVRHTVSDHAQIGLIAPYFTLTRIENAGAFLSLGDGLPEVLRLLLLIMLPLLVMALAFFYLLKSSLSYLRITAICFILGGGIGNIYDRVLYGSVTDFLHIDFVLFETGIFNMADVSIMLGGFILIFDTFRNSQLKRPGF